MSEILNNAKEVLKLEANELIRQAHLLNSDFEKAVNLALHTKGKLVITGVGKSGHIGAKIAATLASTGTPSFFMHPTEALHGDLGMLSSDDCVLAISFSGESEELLSILPHIKRRGIKIIAMARSRESSLGSLADAFISLAIEREACPLGAAPTTSTTLTLALGDALAVCLMKLRGFTRDDFARFHPGGMLGRRLFLKVADVMRSEELPILRDDVSLKEAIDAMTHGKLGTVLLVRENGDLSAILSDGDLRRALSFEDFSLSLPALKFATLNPKTIDDANTLAIEALRLIREYKIQILVVTEGKKPVGVLHIHDLNALGI